MTPHEDTALEAIYRLIPKARRELREEPCGTRHDGCLLRENTQMMLETLQGYLEARYHG